MIITKLKVNDIVVKDRLRGVDSEKVERLKESILRLGLINPITVSGGVLIAGLHRLTAFKELGLDEIDCNVVDDDELLNKEIEIDENLHRNELTVWERGKMEVLKKKHDEEWQKRQLRIQYDTIIPAETTYELAKIDSITPEAKENLIGSVYENDTKFLLDISELDKERQVSVTKNLSVKNVEQLVKAQIIKEANPDKDKNQIKFQLDDDHFEKVKKLVKMYRWKTIPELARKMMESYLNAFFKEDKNPCDNDILGMFEDLSGNLGKDEYQNTKKGYMI